MDLETELNSGLNTLQLALSERQKQQLIDYLHLLKKWNQAYNLTAITELDAMLPLHIFDSLVISPHLHGTRHIDVGTGPGLPGIPLAIILPDQHFTLLDSNGKKTRFLQQAQLSLGLNNIEIIHSRAETYQPSQTFSSVISRAFASVADMLKWTAHLCAVEGRFLAMKGTYPEAELQTLPKGISVEKSIKITAPGVAAQRHLIVLIKKF